MRIDLGSRNLLWSTILGLFNVFMQSIDIFNEHGQSTASYTDYSYFYSNFHSILIGLFRTVANKPLEFERSLVDTEVPKSPQRALHLLGSEARFGGVG